MTISWVTAFLDLPADDHDAGVAFWAAATGYAVSPARGDDGEFATLVPPQGEAFLRTQRLGDGIARVHVDLHVADPLATADRAVSLGAREVARPGHVVLASPGGLPFCLVAADPAPAPRPTSTTSLVDQVCLDIPADLYTTEVAFWCGLTGWRFTPVQERPEFERLTPAPDLPLQFLLQRLDDPVSAVMAHLDLGTRDRRAETRRHVALGATDEGEGDGWRVMRDPAGSAYCLTDRPPFS